MGLTIPSVFRYSRSIMNTQLLNPLYWLTFQSAVVDGLIGKFIFGAFLLCFIFGIVCRIVMVYQSHDRYLKLVGNKVIPFFVMMGILGMVLFFFSFENIQLFGARFWYPVWLIAFVVWAIRIVRFVMRDVPEKRERDLKQHAKSKYIPGRKRSR